MGGVYGSEGVVPPRGLTQEVFTTLGEGSTVPSGGGGPMTSGGVYGFEGLRFARDGTAVPGRSCGFGGGGDDSFTVRYLPGRVGGTQFEDRGKSFYLQVSPASTDSQFN